MKTIHLQQIARLWALAALVVCSLRGLTQQIPPLPSYLDFLPSNSWSLNWNYATNVWDSLSHASYGYGGQDELLSIYTEGYGSTGMSSPSTRTTFLYDTDGNLTYELYESYNQGSWANNSSWHRTWFSGHLRASSYRLDWNGSQWDTIAGGQFSYVLGPGGRVEQSRFAIWQDNIHSYSMGLQDRYHYDGAGEWDTVWHENFTPTATYLQGRDHYDGWHNFAERQPDSSTSMIDDLFLGLALARTDRFRYLNGLVTEQVSLEPMGQNVYRRQVKRYDAKGFALLDSMGMGTSSTENVVHFVNTYDGQGRLTAIDEDHRGPSDSLKLRFLLSYTPLAPAAEAAEDIDAALRVWPVPATDRLHVAVDAPSGGPLRLRLFDAAGRLRIAQDGSLLGGGTTLPLGDGLAAGTYVLRVETTQGAATRRVQILH